VFQAAILTGHAIEFIKINTIISKASTQSTTSIKLVDHHPN
jgi:hypothetical protein